MDNKSHLQAKKAISQPKRIFSPVISLLGLSLFFLLPVCLHGADNQPAVNISNISGVWDSDFGLLNFTLKGNRVNGTYSCCNGIIEGTIKNNRLYFTWKDPIYGQGWGFFIIQENGEELIGHWGVEKNIVSGKWNGTRIKANDFKKTAEIKRGIARNKGQELLKEGYDLLQNGEYKGAVKLFKAAKPLLEQVGDTVKIDLANNGLSLCYNYLGQYENARQLHADTVKNAETSSIFAEASRVMLEMELGGDDFSVTAPKLIDPDDPIELSTKGLKFIAAGKFQDGMATLERALAGYSLLNDAPGISQNIRNSNLISQGNIYMAMAHACYKERKYQRAINQAKNELNIWRQLGSKPNIAQSYTSLGIYYQKIKDFKESLYYFNEAAAIQKKAGLSGIWQTFYFLARLHDEIGNYQQAEVFFEQSIAVIEKLRAGLRTDEAKIGFLSLKIAPFADFVIFLLEKKANDKYLLKALEVTERARVRALMDLLAEKSEESISQSKIAVYYQETFDEWFSPLHIIPRRADEIVHFIQQGETAYIVYFVTDLKTYAWLLLPSGKIHFETINLSKKELTDTVGKLRNNIQNGVHQGYDKTLFDSLLQPLLTRLERSMSSCRKVTIIPHGTLNSLPFIVLSDTPIYPPLLGYDLTYLPALGIAELLKPVHLTPDNRILLVGNPSGANLGSAEDEVTRVAGLFPRNRKLMGKTADKKTVIAEITKGYDAVLFSTHGVPDLDNPQMSHLLLADGDKLTLKDITRLKLNTKLVVMSACETHIGKLFGGDELMALTRGFLASGCDSVLTTLWPVEQKVANQIIVSFFENLKDGLPPAKALRKSQIQYRENTNIKPRLKMPDSWAPFVVIGRN